MFERNRYPKEKLYQPGTKNYNSKLTWDQIIEIRLLYSQGNITQQKLADKFKVTQHSINRIVNNKGYKNEPK